MTDESGAFKCEDCGRSFKYPQNLGRHRTMVHGAVPKEKRKKRGPVTIMSNAEYMNIIKDFEKSAVQLVALVKGLGNEATMYRKERDELAKFKERIVSYTSVKKGNT